MPVEKEQKISMNRRWDKYSASYTTGDDYNVNKRRQINLKTIQANQKEHGLQTMGRYARLPSDIGRGCPTLEIGK